MPPGTFAGADGTGFFRQQHQNLLRSQLLYVNKLYLLFIWNLFSLNTSVLVMFKEMFTIILSTKLTICLKVHLFCQL